MAFPLAAVSTGISLLGSIGGLLGNDEKRARLAQDLALRDLNLGGEQDYTDTRYYGDRGGANLTGSLNDRLATLGRGLGSATAGAGVYNSSATAGALANQQAANAATTGRYYTDLSSTLAGIRNRNRQNVANLKLGFAANDLNYARQQRAGAIGGISSLLGSIGQMNLDNTGTNLNNPNTTGPAAQGTTGSVLQMPRVPQPNLGYGLQPIGGYQPATNYTGGGRLTKPRIGSLSYGWG